MTGKTTDPDFCLRIRRHVQYDFALDLVAIDSASLTRRLKLGDFFLMEALEDGKVLYERINR